MFGRSLGGAVAIHLAAELSSAGKVLGLGVGRSPAAARKGPWAPADGRCPAARKGDSRAVDGVEPSSSWHGGLGASRQSGPQQLARGPRGRPTGWSPAARKGASGPAAPRRGEGAAQGSSGSAVGPVMMDPLHSSIHAEVFDTLSAGWFPPARDWLHLLYVCARLAGGGLTRWMGDCGARASVGLCQLFASPHGALEVPCGFGVALITLLCTQHDAGLLRWSRAKLSRVGRGCMPPSGPTPAP